MPKYLVITGSEKHPPIEKKFLPLRDAGVTYSSLWMPVKIGYEVLEDDGVTVRKITDDEYRQIVAIADEYDASK